MVRLNGERVLVIGDPQNQLEAALRQAMPGAHVMTVATYFDGIAELTANPYTAVLAAAEPIERRPDAAVETLRELAPEARLVLFGHPTLEPLTRKMLEFGCDDYIITPVSPGEIHQIFGVPRMRASNATAAASDGAVNEQPASLPASPLAMQGLPLAEIVLNALSDNPGGAPAAAVKELNEHLAPTMELHYLPPGAPAPTAPEGRIVVSHAVRTRDEEHGQLHLLMPRDDEDGVTARHFLTRLAKLMGQLQVLQERHNRLQKLAITDELTGLYNARYFRHFLSRILERSRQKLFPVTLFMFDIDDFKKYNDRFGHAVGDEILKQTAALIRRCCREHDLVARLGGDEFAVVFWEKEGPRQPKEHRGEGESSVGQPLRPPQTPDQVLERFRKLLASQEFPGLGPSGQGTLTISGGVAVFPYHANSMEELIQLADRRLMFGAKQAGKNSIFLIGGESAPTDQPTH